MKSKILAVLVIAVLMTGGLLFLSCAPACAWGGSCEVNADKSNYKACMSSKCNVTKKMSGGETGAADCNCS